MLSYRRATDQDCPCLAELNQQLIRDEGHRNQASLPELEQRMRAWLQGEGEYTAVVFEEAGEILAYAMFREEPHEVHLRQLFVARPHRRQGVGRRAVEILRSEFWPTNKRLTVDVLSHNEAALGFWRATGYKDYAITLEILPD